MVLPIIFIPVTFMPWRLTYQFYIDWQFLKIVSFFHEEVCIFIEDQRLALQEGLI